jgi:hypothetical protein
MSLLELNVNAREFVSEVPEVDYEAEIQRIGEECARNVFEFDMTENDKLLLEKSKWRRTMNGALKELVSKANDTTNDTTNDTDVTDDAEDVVAQNMKKLFLLMFGYILSIISYVILGFGQKNEN